MLSSRVHVHDVLSTGCFKVKQHFTCLVQSTCSCTCTCFIFCSSTALCIDCQLSTRLFGWVLHAYRITSTLDFELTQTLLSNLFIVHVHDTGTCTCTTPQLKNLLEWNQLTVWKYSKYRIQTPTNFQINSKFKSNFTLRPDESLCE